MLLSPFCQFSLFLFLFFFVCLLWCFLHVIHNDSNPCMVLFYAISTLYIFHVVRRWTVEPKKIIINGCVVSLCSGITAANRKLYTKIEFVAKYKCLWVERKIIFNTEMKWGSNRTCNKHISETENSEGKTSYCVNDVKRISFLGWKRLQ